MLLSFFAFFVTLVYAIFDEWHQGTVHHLQVMSSR
ncbi:VanZ family protein [Gracilibacillus suaedae]